MAMRAVFAFRNSLYYNKIRSISREVPPGRLTLSNLLLSVQSFVRHG